MKKTQNKIRKFIKEFIACIFLVAIILTLAAPITYAQSSKISDSSVGSSTSTTQTSGSTLDSGGSASQTAPLDGAQPTSTGTVITQPGEGKEDLIFVPLNPAGYGDFPQLESRTPTGLVYEFVDGIVTNLKWILGGLAVIYLIVAAIKMIIAGDKEETAGKQKMAIMYVIFGLVAVGMADEIARVLSVACAPGQVECARGGFLKDPNNIIQQAAFFKQTTRVVITFIKYIIGGIAIFMFIRNGIRLIGLAGSEESITLDKKNLAFTSIGLLMIVVASTFIDRILYVIDPSKYTAAGAQPVMDVSAGVQEVIGITNFVVVFVAPIAILALIGGALMYATAAGNEDQTNKAKRIILLAVLGMALIYGAFAIITTITLGTFTP